MTKGIKIRVISYDKTGQVSINHSDNKVVSQFLQLVNRNTKTNMDNEAKFIVIHIANSDKSGKKIRAGWDEAFKKMHLNGDDKLLISDILEDENPDEWL